MRHNIWDCDPNNITYQALQALPTEVTAACTLMLLRTVKSHLRVVVERELFSHPVYKAELMRLARERKKIPTKEIV